MKIYKRVIVGVDNSEVIVNRYRVSYEKVSHHYEIQNTKVQILTWRDVA